MLATVGIVDAARDARDGVGDVALVLVFHADGALPLASGRGAGLSDNGSADDFDFREVLVWVGGVMPHAVGEVLFVTVMGWYLGLQGGGFQREWGKGDLPFSDILSKNPVMLILNQCRCSLHVLPDFIDRAIP